MKPCPPYPGLQSLDLPQRALLLLLIRNFSQEEEFTIRKAVRLSKTSHQTVKKFFNVFVERRYLVKGLQKYHLAESTRDLIF